MRKALPLAFVLPLAGCAEPAPEPRAPAEEPVVATATATATARSFENHDATPSDGERLTAANGAASSSSALASSVPATTAAPSAPVTTTTTATAMATPPGRPKGPFKASTHPGMVDPSRASLSAPAVFKVKFVTSAGDFQVTCRRSFGPKVADRFFNLVKIGFYDDVAFFRVVRSPQPFVVQFGISGVPAANGVWSQAFLSPDPVKHGNKRGTLTFAMSGDKQLTTQVFINYGDNSRLDAMGFAAICDVDGEGMSVVDAIFSGYGEKPSRSQERIQKEGNAFLRREFPELDYIETARIVP